MSGDRSPTIYDFVDSAKRKYTLVVLLHYREIGWGGLEICNDWAISFPTLTMANGATVRVLALTEVYTLRVNGYGSGH